MKSLKLLMEKPYLEWETEDQLALPELIKSLLNSGTTIVLGEKRCFFCGAEMDEEVIGARLLSKVVKVGLPMVVTNLCDNCYKLGDNYANL